ncbi:DUF4148 domain-containing protein [Trinickia mobilis]|uniref:DUF4148 domain-containing protein n=1 Tax=Trinickia mobilis TaxID=2816356 RepID=UPI001A8F0058|nr:DUF4148 domain-containing protein [Trinickia mobilis]
MKRTTLLNRSLFAALLLSISVSVFATPPHNQQQGWQSSVPMASAPAPLLAEATIDSASAKATPVAPAPDSWTAVGTGTAARGKTHAQVYAELVQAEEAGVIPGDNVHYPATPDMQERNRRQFQQAEKWWRRGEQVNASAH